MKKLLLTTLLLCAGLAATAYEYQFNWAQMEQNAYTETTVPDDGINIFIHTLNDDAPNLYAWDPYKKTDEKLAGEWPGTPLTTLKAINANGQSEKKHFYLYHIDANELSAGALKFIVNKNGNQSAATTLRGEGCYYFDYSGTSITDVTNNYVEVSSGGERIVPTTGTNIFVRVLGSDNQTFNDNATPYIHAWKGTTQITGEGFLQMPEVIYINGAKWFYWHTDNTDWTNGGIVINDQDNNTNKHQTADIDNTSGKTLVTGDNFYYYYPYGDGWKFSVQDASTLSSQIPTQSRTNNFTAWNYDGFRKVDGKNVIYSHGKATITIACVNAEDIQKVTIQDGELAFPKDADIIVSVEDGYNLNKVWFGKPVKGEQSYGFDGRDALTTGYIKDMGYKNEIWTNDISDHLYKITNTTTAEFGDISTQHAWQGDVFYLSAATRVYSEGTSLEELINAHYGVKRLNQAIDHDIVGVGVRTINGKEMLIARSIDYIENQYPIAEGQRSVIDPATGKAFEWSDPNTKQYAWIAIELGEGDPNEYIGKQLRGVRGEYCGSNGTKDHIGWYNPCLLVDRISDDQIVAEEVETKLNTYTVLNLTDQSYQHTYHGDRVTDHGENEKDYLVSGLYYLLRPQLCEMCNIIDVMRTDDEVLWCPDTRAIMPTVEENGREVIKSNVYVQHKLVGYANVSREYVSQIWKQADIEYGCVGNEWRMRNKVYDIPEALIVATDFHKNDYPLMVPDRKYDIELGTTGAIGLHIIGIAKLAKYEKDILVSNSDYWSRYNYKLDKNAYRNDLQIAPNTLSSKFATMGNLLVERCDNMGGNKVTIAKLTQTWGGGENSTLMGYHVEYMDPNSLQDARNDVDLLKILPAANFIKTDFNIGNYGSSYIEIHDMFYSQPMTSKEDNGKLYPMYLYHVRPENQSVEGFTEVAGYAPVYKTDVNVAGHSMYTKSQVDGDIDDDDRLQDDGKVKVYFTPNHATAVTSYNVLGGKGESFDYAATKSSTDLVNVNATNFMDNGIEIANAEQYKEYVPEAFTDYNYNTYGCYKEEVGNATVTMTTSKLYESETHDNEYIYFCNLNLSTVLNLVKNDERYLLRVWRKVGGEPKVLLNEQEEFTREYFDMGLKIVNDEGDRIPNEQLYTHYGELNTWAQKTGDGLDVESKQRMVPDMFKHKDIDETTDVTYIVKLYVQDNKVLNAAQGVAPAGAPRRAPQDDVKAYYVKRVEQSVRVSGVITGVDGIHSDAAVSSVRYVNVAGQVSDKPWSGVNMVVTTLADGTTRTSKIVR